MVYLQVPEGGQHCIAYRHGTRHRRNGLRTFGAQGVMSEWGYVFHDQLSQRVSARRGLIHEPGDQELLVG